MQPSFSINWGEVLGSEIKPAGWRMYALWPAPVNDDVCFTQAGYSNFQCDDKHYSEAYWDAQAEILHQRLIAEFSKLGKPMLLSWPLSAKKSLFKFWQESVPLSMGQQLLLPMYEDSLPQASVRFGETLELRTGNGHVLYWIGLSPRSMLDFEQLLPSIAMGWSVKQQQLDWNKLGYGGQAMHIK